MKNFVNSVPDDFDISIYDVCASWGLKDWVAELSARSFMSYVFAKEREGKLTDELRSSYVEQAEKFLLTPLRNFCHQPDIYLSPIMDQSADEFFRGHRVLSDSRYRAWVQRMEDTEKHGDLVLDGDLEFDEEICRNVHEYLSSPAWKIHRDSLGQVKRFFIGVDLNASDDYLVKQFRSWIAKTRAEADIEPKQWLFSDKRFEKWHKDRLLPYLDLTFWATINHKKIKPADMEEILFQGKFDGFPGENVTKKIAKEAVKLISDATLYALNVELRTYECVMSGKS